MRLSLLRNSCGIVAVSDCIPRKLAILEARVGIEPAYTELQGVTIHAVYMI